MRAYLDANADLPELSLGVPVVRSFKESPEGLEARMSEQTPSPWAPFAPVLFPLAMSLTLGLAPFTPEPHLIGKIRWVAGGAVGMSLMDWGDLVMHGAPVVWLVLALGWALRGWSKARTPSGPAA